MSVTDFCNLLTYVNINVFQYKYGYENKKP